MKILITFISICLFTSCEMDSRKLTPNFDDFIYVHMTIRENSSLKFTGGDTIYLQKRLPDQPVLNFAAVLNTVDQDSLIYKINKLNLDKYQPNKYLKQDIEAANSMVFILNQNQEVKFISVHGGTVSKEIDDLGKWIKSLEVKLQFFKTEKNLKFWDIKGVVPPPPPPSIVRNVLFTE